MMKSMERSLSAVLLFMFAFSVIAFLPGEALAVKKKKRIRYRRSARFYRKRAIPFKAYFEYYLTPVVKQEDKPNIIESLKKEGVSSAKFDSANNSLILQFRSSQVTALDIMKTLKDFGYTVSSIN